MRPLALILTLALAVLPQLSRADEARKPTKLQLVGGDSITGTVSGVKDDSVSILTDYGVIRVPVAKLTEASRKDLGISANANVEQLQKRVTELEALVERLRSENADLRRQGTSAPQPSTPKIHPLVTGGTTPAPPTATTSSSATGGSFWISSTGKRHNPRCRYYGTGQGHPGTAAQGIACKICGG